MELIQIKSMKCVCVGKKYNYVSKGKTACGGVGSYIQIAKKRPLLCSCACPERPHVQCFSREDTIAKI